jgi:hypothetical protein
MGRIFLLQLTVGCLILWHQNVGAHGGVGMEDDMCVLKIGFLTAHFTGYQPLTNGTKEFCEDIPEVGSSIFVIDYMHDFLKEMLVDFRIIRDVNKFGVFANWDDISSLEDIEKDTVFYLPALKQPAGVLKAKYDFKEAGGYIGIVTAIHPEKKKNYHAVFYFQVGGDDYGYIPLFILLVVLVQALYLLNNRIRRNQVAGK